MLPKGQSSRQKNAARLQNQKRKLEIEQLKLAKLDWLEMETTTRNHWLQNYQTLRLATAVTVMVLMILLSWPLWSMKIDARTLPPKVIFPSNLGY